MERKKLRWMPLDNAAKIYPAAGRKDWSNIFRISATLTQRVDSKALEKALAVTVNRFPLIAARLRRGVFWYYLQELDRPPEIRQDCSYPLAPMSRLEVRRCALRVLVYENRIALELFHSLTDGTGAMILLKTLVAEYLKEKYGISVPCELGVLDVREEPAPGELEDSFLKHGAPIRAPRGGSKAWKLPGTREPDDFQHLTCFRLDTPQLLEKAHAYGVTVTAFLGAVMLYALQTLQQEQEPDRRRKRPVKVLLPVNLRRLFLSNTLRNFAMYTIAELQTELGHYTLEEICSLVKHKMGLEITQKHMRTVIATNIADEQKLALRLVPLFLKNIVMKAVFLAVGENQSCLSLSNLGQVAVPAPMQPYITRFDFILGVQVSAPYNCGALSYGDTTYINFIRNIREPMLERHFFSALQKVGISVTLESNRGERSELCTAQDAV